MSHQPLVLNPPAGDDEVADLFDAAYLAHNLEHIDSHTACAALSPTLNYNSNKCWQWRQFAIENKDRLIAFRRAILNGVYCECCRTHPHPHTPMGTRY